MQQIRVTLKLQRTGDSNLSNERRRFHPQGFVMADRDVRATSPQLLVVVNPLNQHGSIENSGRNEVLDCENESGPTEVVEKRTAFVFKALQCVGLIGGERSRKFALLVSVTMWLPPISLAVCVSKNPIMSSPSGLPTVLLFSGLALSHHFGALYGFRNQERLRRNIYLAFQRANFCRTCVIVTVVFGILTLPYLALLVYLYVMQPIRPVPWLQITVVYFFGYIYCALASVGINLAFSTACSVIKIRINDFKRKFQTWSEGLSEALTEYQELCDFMQEEIDAIKWWLLVNVICFFVIWLVDFHLWQILASREGEADIVRLVFYNCSWSNPLPAPELWLPGRLITLCEILFSSLVFFFFMSPLFWAAMVTVHCNRFREWVNRTQVRTDERPLGNFSVTSLDFFISRVQMATYFAFKLFGINVTKVLISVTGLMTTVQFVLTIATKKLFAS